MSLDGDKEIAAVVTLRHPSASSGHETQGAALHIIPELLGMTDSVMEPRSGVAISTIEWDCHGRKEHSLAKTDGIATPRSWADTQVCHYR